MLTDVTDYRTKMLEIGDSGQIEVVLTHAAMAARFLAQWHRFNLLIGAMTAVLSVAACDSTSNFGPMTQGEQGNVVPLPDGGHSDAARDATLPGTMATGGGGTGNVGGNGGHGTAGSTGTAGAGGVGGAAGSGPVDDPCTACEKARCSHPMGQTAASTGDEYAGLAGAYAVCFTGTGWPSSGASTGIFCGGQPGETGATAVSGPARGTAKSTLCQSILKCVHQTNCTDGEETDNQSQCYCGEGVSVQTCLQPGFTPTGLCDTQIAAGLESTVFATSAGFFHDACLANGAAFLMYDFCDANCCVQECLGTPLSGYEDPTYCNATGAGGSSGSGGIAGAAGSTGTGGSLATGGASGHAGSTGSGGSSGAGGQTATGGATGTAGAGGTATQSAACTSCEMAGAATGYCVNTSPVGAGTSAADFGCFGFTDPTDQRNCFALVNCLRGPACQAQIASADPSFTEAAEFDDSPLPCLCGTAFDTHSNPEAACVTATSGFNGVCAAEFIAASASAADPIQDPTGNYANQDYPEGTAKQLMQCDVDSSCLARCSGETTGSGGTAGSGGAAGSGGTGAAGTGGAAGSGGAVGSGGTAGSGGAAGSGGTTGTAGSGGAAGSGGTTGTAGSGGAAGSGGTGAAGTGGAGGAPPGLLQNGQFDTSTAGWSASYGATVNWSPTDSASSVQSGSLDLALTGGNPAISIEVAASQCVAASAGSIYDISGKIMIPNAGTNQGSLGLWFYASNDCSGSISSVFSSNSSVTNGWQTLTTSDQAPAGVHSMAVRVQLTKALDMQSAEALFDDVVVKVE